MPTIGDALKRFERSEEGRNLVAELMCEAVLNLGREPWRIGRVSVEEHIPAGEKVATFRKPGASKLAQSTAIFTGYPEQLRAGAGGLTSGE